MKSLLNDAEWRDQAEMMDMTVKSLRAPSYLLQVFEMRECHWHDDGRRQSAGGAKPQDRERPPRLKILKIIDLAAHETSSQLKRASDLFWIEQQGSRKVSSQSACDRRLADAEGAIQEDDHDTRLSRLANPGRCWIRVFIMMRKAAIPPPSSG